ncbi:heparinase II/III family protein [Aquibacillus salsiterrae]|uniref:Heparinase II/III family protein n=1 Tax=Aquibacillus salsiterrae TaxID=2950439 RepID=A0A9X3WBS4_9BACI|nr:heparinase II/III family protein [Aquibacillus salsiterrae]MDC3416777.1 heparinase II/III family protein [Aquibacillus salsiterrae]
MDRRHIKKSLAIEVNQTYSLLFSSKKEQLAAFKNMKTNPNLKTMIEEIVNEAESILQEPVQEITYNAFKRFFEDGSRLDYEKVYFAKRHRLTTFALANLLYPENKKYLDALQEIIWGICNEYSWCLPAHINNGPETSLDDKFSLEEKQLEYTVDLFAAETSFALSEILKLTKDNLDPLICERIRQEIYRRVVWPYSRQHYHWESATHNWAAVCAGSIGSTALHLFNDEEELSVILERVIESMKYYISGFNSDGTCMEGYGYWEYGFGFYVYFSDLLKKRTAGKIDLFDNKKVREIALFQQKTFLDKNKVVNFSDSASTASVFLGLSHYLSKLYHGFTIPEKNLRAHFTDDHCGRWAPAIRNIIWFDDRAIGKPWSDATYYMEDSQWFISRHSTNKGRFALAAKGGHNAEPHNHNDVGHFILYGNEKTYLKDLGRGEYNADYFGNERYSFLCNSSQGHSVPIVNNQFQLDGERRAATVTEIITGSGVEKLEMELSGVYDVESLRQLTRSFTWRKTANPSLVLGDLYEFSKSPEAIVERFILPMFSISESADGILVDNTLSIIFDKSQLDLNIEEIKFSNHEGHEETNMALDFNVKNLKKKQMIQIIFQF